MYTTTNEMDMFDNKPKIAARNGYSFVTSNPRNMHDACTTKVINTSS